ncbi:splicing factor, Prp19-binding domain-containing protein [Lipomyces oligophaga]|uniref:splicing factor, Prp19-binding domain-containing protein n=1 Tax=Lipomyces oligophaga TaxID=45792 RepID=UPI0034CD5C07
MPPRLQQVKRQRYFPGKRLSRSPSPQSSGSSSSASGSDSEEEHKPDVQIGYVPYSNGTVLDENQRDVSIAEYEGQLNIHETDKQTVIKELKDVDLSSRFKRAPQVGEERTIGTIPKMQLGKEENPESEEESEEESDESDDESDESEVEEQQKVILRPVFIPKGKRGVAASKASEDAVAAAAKSASKETKRQNTLSQIEDSIRAEAAAHAARRVHEDNAVATDTNEVDDTDDLDPRGERAAWRLRELKRISREREQLEERERELQEVEERRNMDEEDKLKEDLARIKQQREDKANRAGGFMNKYYHRGAFYQDQDILKRTDYAVPTIDEYRDKSVLPKVMQVRNTDDLGKRGRSRWTHLSAEDTSMQTESPWFDRSSKVNRKVQDRLGGLHDIPRKKREHEGSDSRDSKRKYDHSRQP